MESLGIDLKLLLAQAINFLILLVVLKIFLYQPILKMLSSRKQKIAKSLKDAEAAEEALKHAEGKSRETMSKAIAEAEAIVKQAHEDAKLEAQKIVKESQKKADLILELAQKQADKEKDKILNKAKMSLGDLVSLAVEKIVGTKESESSIARAIDEIE